MTTRFLQRVQNFINNPSLTITNNTMIRFFPIALLVLMTVMVIPESGALYAQDARQMELIRSELDARGLSETEVRTRLMREGINVDTMTPDQIAERRGEIEAILDQMQAEREAADRAEDPEPADTMPEEPVVPRPLLPGETETQIRQRMMLQQEPEPTEIYGHAIFTDQTLEIFETVEAARAPDTYVLGPGDQIRVNIFGTSQADLHFEINSEGYVQPSEMPMIFLKGLTMREARTVLFDRLSDFYTFRSDQFALTIQSARTITVNVFGESRLRGGFTVSALNTAFNALAAAGGPSEIGSVRNIRVIRGSERRTMDVYEFMDDPSVQFDFDLQHNDILFVPVAEKVVRIRGAVRRPMRYELVEGESLRDLIRYAGGVNFDTAPDFVQIRRVVGDEPVLKEWRLSEVLSGEEHVPMQDGDEVRVRTIGRPMERFVEIEGSVYYPGEYSLEQSPTLSALLERAELRSQAKTDRLFIERTLPDESIRVIPVEWDEVERTGEEIPLERRDRVIVFDRERYRHVAIISVVGNVRQPYEQQMAYDERLSVRDALQLAGGMQPTAADIAYIFRQDLFNDDIVEHIRVDLTRDSEFELQPGDQLNVYDRSTYSDIGSLSIGGAVNETVNTQFDPELTVSDLLKMAGGFARGAALNRVDIFRLDLSLRLGTRYDVITLEADSLMNVVSAPEGFRLQPFDRVVVRRIPQFNLAAAVEIDGEVMYPGVYPLESRRIHLSDVVLQAGGTTGVADPNNAVIFRSHNNMGPIAINIRDAMRNRGDERYDPVIFAEDLISIPRFSNTVSIRINATRVGELIDAGVVPAQVVAATAPEAITTPVVTGVDPVFDVTQWQYQTINIPFQGNRSARWYIENFAGGFAQDADKWSVTVTTGSGQVKGTRRRMLFFRNYPDVPPGSTIALRLEPPEPLEERERIDWDRVYQRSLQATTSLLTILVMIDRLTD